MVSTTVLVAVGDSLAVLDMSSEERLAGHAQEVPDDATGLSNELIHGGAGKELADPPPGEQRAHPLMPRPPPARDRGSVPGGRHGLRAKTPTSSSSSRRVINWSLRAALA